MALIRLEIQNRLGDRSIFDGIVEFESDFTNEPKLATLHAGSAVKCLNIPNGGTEAAPITTWVKCSDGEWRQVL